MAATGEPNVAILDRLAGTDAEALALLERRRFYHRAIEFRLQDRRRRHAVAAAPGFQHGCRTAAGEKIGVERLQEG